MRGRLSLFGRPPHAVADETRGNYSYLSLDSRCVCRRGRYAERYFSQVPLIDQNGRTVRFYADLIKGKVVLLHSFFSTCTTDCPAVFNKLKQAQEALGDRFGKDVFFVSVTVEPGRDTPQKLQSSPLTITPGRAGPLCRGKRRT